MHRARRVRTSFSDPWNTGGVQLSALFGPSLGAVGPGSERLVLKAAARSKSHAKPSSTVC